MKEIYKKTAQIGLALLISWIVSYGIVFAQPLCCGIIIDSCIPALKKTHLDATLKTKCGESLSHRPSLHLHAVVSPELLLADFGTDPNCCEKEMCAVFNQTVYSNTSSSKYPKLLAKWGNLIDFDSGFQNPLFQKTQSIPLRLTSIYILTKSMIR